MKKMFTLFTGLLMAIAVMAADRRPMVTVNSMRNYKVVIDGRSFFTNSRAISIANLHDGRHSIQVYEMQRGQFQRRERLVSSSSFRLNNKDVKILIDHYGQINIQEQRRYGRFERNDRDDNRDWNDRDWKDRSDRDERDWNDRNDRNDRNGRDDRNGRY
ncbi:MAG TPA: hypothetical protein VMZ03_02945 [Chitinophagaceae bacterium]|nr:hypothetical protein [Chitinophagaceae bacterium]